MKQFNWLLLLILFVVSDACTSSKTTAKSNSGDRDIQYTNLVQLLRGKPGLKITGSGDNVTVLIRGERSFFGNNEPLYMLDDIVIGNSFSEAVTGIDPTTLKSADIITPANAGRFGGRGGNGVIIFRSKRKR